MPQKTNATIKIEVPDKSKKALEKTAASLGISLDDLLARSINLCPGFTPATWKTLREIADIFRVKESDVIINLLCRYVAENIAAENIFGPDVQRIYPEFYKINGKKLITGNALISWLIPQWEQVFRITKRASIDAFIAETRRDIERTNEFLQKHPGKSQKKAPAKKKKVVKQKRK